MKSEFLIAALAAHSHSHSHSHSLQIMQFCALTHSFIYTSICIYSFALLPRSHTHTQTHTSIAHEQRDGGKLKMQTKCTIYTHIHAQFMRFFLTMYILFFIINDARFSEYISMEVLLSLSLVSFFSTKCVQIKFKFQFLHRLHTHTHTSLNVNCV